MLRRELSIVFRARVTWLQATLCALLVGHSFVLATDLYSAGSRSVLANRLMSREFDPLLGIVRPTLGGLYFAVSLLGAIVAVRPLAIEKERRTFHSLLLQTGSPMRVLAAQAAAGVMGLGLQFIAPIGLFGVWVLLGGHLGLGETATALLGQALYVVLVAALATAAAAWTNTLAQAATVTLVVIAASWAIDASEGFAALAWLGGALDWSVSTHLMPLERGTLPLGTCLWMGITSAGAFTVAYVGTRFDVPVRRRVAFSVWVIALTAGGGAMANRVRAVFDCTEMNRVSLPPAVSAGLREVPGAIALDVYLDRDDARRQQLERDAIAKLRLARPDLDVRTPVDAQIAPATGERDEGYGRIAVHVGDQTRTTYSTSRKELVTLVFEAVGRPVPDWSTVEYPGYPLVIDGQRRTVVALLAYFGFPAACVLAGLWATRIRRWRTR